jgi:hypothetical protein
MIKINRNLNNCHLFTETEGNSVFCGPEATVVGRHALNLLVDANSSRLTSGFIIDRSIIVSSKACTEHDVLWTGT